MARTLQKQIFYFGLFILSVDASIKACEVTGPTCTIPVTSDPVTGAIALSVNNCLAIAQSNGTIATYSYNQTVSCCLTPCCDVSFAINAAYGNTGLSYSPDGSCLAVSNSNSCKVTLFPVNCDCCLGKGNTFRTQSPTDVIFCSNNSLFVGKENSTIADFKVNNCKAKFEVSEGQTVLQAPTSFAISLDGSCLALIDNNYIYTFSIDNCSLTCQPVSKVGVPSVPAPFNPSSLAWSPDNACLLVIDTIHDTVYSFCVSNCHVSATSSAAIVVPTVPVQAAFFPTKLVDDTYCFAVASQKSGTNSGAISIGTVSTTTICCAIPTLTIPPAFTSPSGALGRAIAWSPSGCLFYVDQNNIYTFTMSTSPKSVVAETRQIISEPVVKVVQTVPAVEVKPEVLAFPSVSEATEIKSEPVAKPVELIKEQRATTWDELMNNKPLLIGLGAGACLAAYLVFNSMS